MSNFNFRLKYLSFDKSYCQFWISYLNFKILFILILEFRTSLFKIIFINAKN